MNGIGVSEGTLLDLAAAILESKPWGVSNAGFEDVLDSVLAPYVGPVSTGMWDTVSVWITCPGYRMDRFGWF